MCGKQFTFCRTIDAQVKPIFPPTIFGIVTKKLKSLLNMCALVTIQHDRELKAYYKRKVAEGKPKMLVINNVRCKLLSRVFAVVNRNLLLLILANLLLDFVDNFYQYYLVFIIEYEMTRLTLRYRE